MKNERADLISNRKSRIGQFGKNNLGSVMEVINYKNSTDVLIKFVENGNLVKASWQQFCEGEVKNPYDKSIFGKGYLGIGQYKAFVERKATHQYASWKHMLERCYDEKLHKKHPTYIGTFVCEEWLNFQNYAQWYDENYYKIDGERMHLDKDILVKGNKQYSPETCVFVPSRINSLFTKCNSSRGNTPIGVTYVTRDEVYVARCMTGRKNKRKILGSFDDPIKAFNSYKKFKEDLIKQIANEYINEIPNSLYKAMMNYIVEITD